MPVLPRAAALVAACLFGLPASAAEAQRVTVFAAASLKTALDEMAADFTAASGHQVLVSYAGSSQLARQIEAGAPADIFIAASPDWMDEVAAAGLLAPDGRRDILSNRLVLIGHGTAAAPFDLRPDADLHRRLAGGKLAMALTGSVPAGQYGKAALSALGLWDQVAGDVAETDNVRAALALVATGAAPLGIVYATDAVAETRVSVLATFPEDSHPPIRYPAGLLASAAEPADRQFFDALTAEPARAIFAAQGFGLPD